MVFLGKVLIVLKTVLMMYITLLPAIISGILNMIWCKLPILSSLKVPMDFKKKFRDGKRIFGDNKTWKGFIGYLILNTLCSIIWGFICKIGNFSHLNYFYVNNSNTILFNLFIGFLLGLGYSLFELPNSFLKRRFNIVEGKNPEGLKKYIFIFLDQADSVFGCCLVVWLFYNLGIKLYLLYVLLGAVTHILVNMLLYFLHLRKNMF